MISFPGRFLGWRRAPSLAFAAVVALAYLSAFWQHAVHFNHPRGEACLVLGVIYASLGTIDFSFLCHRTSGRMRALYLCTQGILLFGILWTSRLSGDMVICSYCLLAATVGVLGPWAATLGVAILYGMILAVEGHFYGIHALARWSVEMPPAFGFVVIFTRIAMNEKAARTRAESLSAEVEKLAVIHERNRLAREIHDSLGHFLTTIHVQLEAAKAIHAAEPARALEAVAKAQGLARDALVEVRRSVEALQADGAPVPLAARLRDLASATDGWGTAVSLEILGEPRALGAQAEHSLFRAAQEGLTNVRKHAQAKAALVTLDYRDPRRVFVGVTDDGRGAAASPSGHGLTGLRERVAALGGSVVAANATGGGFRLQVEIPA